MVNVNEKSEFNDAIGFLRSLRGYFNLANHYSKVQDAYNWGEMLLVIYRELINFIDEEVDVKDIKDSINMYIKNKNRTNMVGIPSDLYWKLHDFHIILKRVYGKSGLETKLLDDASKALGG